MPLTNVLLSRRVGATAGFVVAMIILGCMSISFQGRQVTVDHVTEEGVSCHKGKVHVPANECLDVYYPFPFAAKPNLELCDAFDRCELVTQCEDHFRIRNKSCFGASCEWKARGLKAIAAPPPALVGAPADHPPEPASAPPPKPLPANP